MLHVTICSKYMHNISLFSTLCDVMNLLNKGYSENGTNVKANRIQLVKIELLAEIKEHSPTVQHKF